MSTSTPETDVRRRHARPGDRRRAASPSTSSDARSATPFSGYISRLRSGDPGALPSVLGLDRPRASSSARSATASCQQHNIGNLPGPGRLHRRHRAGPGVRPAARRDRPVGRHRRRHLRRRSRRRRSSPGDLHDALPGVPLLEPHRRHGLCDRASRSGSRPDHRRRSSSRIGSCSSLTNLDQHVVFALVAAVCIGAAIGIFIGYLVAKVGIPSFIVTLALFLAWQGVLLFVLNSQPIGTTNYNALVRPGLRQPVAVLELGVHDRASSAATSPTRSSSRSAPSAGASPHDTISLVAAARRRARRRSASSITYLANQNRNTNPFK